MADESNSPASLTDFTPVPRQCERHDGWTPERQKLFIEALADYGNVRAACDSVGLADVGAYRLRRQPGAEEFAAAWEAALAHGVKRLEDALMNRALNGVEVPVYSYGKLIGARTVYDNRLGMFILRNRAPHRFAVGGGAKGLNAVDKMHLARLKKQWREEWQREQWALEQEEEKETLESLDRYLADMRQRRWNNMSPRAREAYEEAARIAREDGTDWMLDELEAEEEAGEEGAPPPPLLEGPANGADAEGTAADEEAAPPGPKVRSLKDDGW